MTPFEKSIIKIISDTSNFSGKLEAIHSLRYIKPRFDELREAVIEIYNVDFTVAEYDGCLTVKDFIKLIGSKVNINIDTHTSGHSSGSNSSAVPNKQKQTSLHSEEITDDVTSGYASTGTKQTIDSLQMRRYKTGKNGSTGKGTLAEDYNAMVDRRTGHQVDKVGVTNAKNGPDRIVDGKQIQVKYYKTAKQTVNSAFDDVTGLYKYKYRNGRPQQLEVPRGQGKDAIELMRVKIQEGKVTGVKNPDHASKMIREGYLSHPEAEAMAKTGNVPGIWHDIQQNAIVIAVAGGISAAMAYRQAKKDGKTDEEALKAAAVEGGKSAAMVGGITWVTGQATRTLTPKVIGQAAKTTGSVVASFGAQKGTQKGVEHAVKGTLTKIANSNVVTGTITTAIVSIPDVIDAAKGNISGAECAERVTTNAGSVAGGMAGGIAGGQGGAALGAAIGTAICPGAGTAVGAAIGEIVGVISGGIGGSVAGGAATKGVINTVKGWFVKKK